MLKQVNPHRMIKTVYEGVGMKNNWKYKLSRVTGGNPKLDRKILKLKSSWDEVEKMLNSSTKKKGKR